MFKNILVTSLRTIVRNKFFSLINLTGLSVSMALGLLLILILHEQTSFDSFHKDSARIYRINTRALRVEGDNELYASVPLPVGRVLKEEYTFSEDVVRINRRLRADATYKDVSVSIYGLFTDPSFLTVFNFQLERGSLATALAAPNSVILTAQASEKIFGKADPVGETITFGRLGDFVVSGVLKPFPGKTHFDFEVLAPIQALTILESRKVMHSGLDDWTNYYSGYVYLKLKEGSNSSEVEKALAEMATKYYAGVELEARDKGYQFELNQLSDITPGPELSNQMGQGMPMILILFLGGLAAIVMIMACFNYTNLMLAKSLTRSREIGVRKVVGAQRWQVFAQFAGESVVFSLIALAFAYLILQVLKPAFTQFYFAKQFPSELNENVVVYFYFLAFAAIVGLIAGILPATWLSAFRPASVLKDSGNVKVLSRLTLRKILVGAQFTLSIVFIVIILVVYRQASFMAKKDYSFNEEGIFNVYLNGMPFEKFANEVRRLPGVTSVGGVSHALGTYADRYGTYRRSAEGEKFQMRDFMVDDNYVSNLRLKFIAGENFEAGRQGGFETQVILNERGLQEFAFKDAISALGQPIYAEDSLMLTVIGVVENFNFRPLNYEIGPLALRYNLRKLAILSASIVPSQQQAVTASIEALWKQLDPIHPFHGVMMPDQIDDAYWNGGFLDIIQVTGYISVIAIVMACLGILGMSMYATQTRIKEIGVRKVMGASSRQITILLSRSFLVLIGLGIAFGLPIGYLLGVAFVEDFAYQIEVGPALLLSAVGIVVTLGVLAIGSQTWKAAEADPVLALRYE